MENILEIRNLCKRYDDFELKNINLELPKGMVMGLIGENGAGKTTLIRAILNLLKDTSGEIKVFGKNNKEYEKQIKEDIGVVLDDSFFSDNMNPEDIDVIMRNIYKNWNERKYVQYLENFKLPKNKSIKDYSSGMKMKLKLAVALSHNAKFLILDEPTSGLDPIARNEILDVFRDFIIVLAVVLQCIKDSSLLHLDDIIFTGEGALFGMMILQIFQIPILVKYGYEKGKFIQMVVIVLIMMVGSVLSVTLIKTTE